MGEAQQNATVPAGACPARARDRLSSTLFLAALFHGVVILGIGFSGGDDAGPPPTSLDVVIVTDGQAPSLAPDEARLLAQRDLDGAGNTRTADRLQTALAAAPPAPAPGPERDGAWTEAPPGDTAPPETATLTALAALDPEQRTPDAADAAEPAPVARTGLPGDGRLTEIIDDPAQDTLITDPSPRELVISAATRESRIAGYLDDWKRRVERVGTLNFPRQAALEARTRHPTLEVAIGADGHLREVVVRRSSGMRSVDDAAIAILRLAGPFEPFPEALRSDYDVLRFAYEWRFGAAGGVGRMTALGES